MHDSVWSRRRLLLFAGAAMAASVNPALDSRGKFTWMRGAEAAWLQVATLAISAISAFSRGSGDGGVGAYLANIKELSEENIELTRQVLIRVGELQSQLAQMPDQMRRIFEDVLGYNIRQDAQTALDKLLLVEAHVKATGRLSQADRIECDKIIDICTNLAGARSITYGRGGTAAACISLIGSVEARAWHLKKNKTDFGKRVAIAYLPWFDEILKDQDRSLFRTFLEEGARLAAIADSALAGLPDAQRNAMAAEWKRMTTLEPGAAGSAQVYCGAYARHTSNNRGKCREYDFCDWDRHMPTGLPERVERLLRANEVTVTSQDLAQLRSMGTTSLPADLLPSGGGGIARRCGCLEYEQIPVYTPENGAGLFATLKSEPGTDVVPPRVNVAVDWRAIPAQSCGVATQGGAAGTQPQFEQARAAGPSVAAEQAMQRFIGGGLALYNDQKAIVYSTYKLLEATRIARGTFERVAA